MNKEMKVSKSLAGEVILAEVMAQVRFSQLKSLKLRHLLTLHNQTSPKGGGGGRDEGVWGVDEVALGILLGGLLLLLTQC